MLNSAARRLILINGLFTLANGLSGLFTNVYLWRLRPGVTTPAYYNLWIMLTVMVMMPLLGGYVKRRGAVLINAAGMVLYAGFYLTLLLLQEQAALHLPWLGIFMGTALSCYALATHVLAYDLTDEANREAFYNRNGLITSLAGLLAPLTAGWLVSSLSGLAGYRIIFLASFVIFAAAALLGMGLQTDRPATPYRLGAVLPGSNRRWHRMLLACGFQGLRDGLFSFAVSLLIFLATGGERSVGNFTFLTSVVGMGAFWVAGRVMTPHNRERLFPLGAVVMGLGTAIIGLGATWQILLAHGLLMALATPFWQTAWSAAGFDVIKEAAGDRDLRVEMIAAREIPLNLGRVASLLVVLRYSPSDGSPIFLQGLIAVLGLTFLAQWLLVRRRPTRSVEATL